MRNSVIILVGLVGLLTAAPAQAGIRWSIGIGLPFPFCGPCYGPPAYYYRPVYVAPPPTIIVQPAPVAVAAPVAPAASVVTAQSVELPPAPPPAPGYAAPASATSVVARAASPEVWDPAGLTSADVNERARAAVEAGKRKDRQALARLMQILRDDASAQVREAAARGLGLLGDSRSLAALQYAAQADDDREVRRSAAFAADVIRGSFPRR